MKKTPNLWNSISHGTHCMDEMPSEVLWWRGRKLGSASIVQVEAYPSVRVESFLEITASSKGHFSKSASSQARISNYIRTQWLLIAISRALWYSLIARWVSALVSPTSTLPLSTLVYSCWISCLLRHHTSCALWHVLHAHTSNRNGSSLEFANVCCSSTKLNLL